MKKSINHIKSYRGVRSSIPTNNSAGILNRMMVLHKEAALLKNQLNLIESKRSQLTNRLDELQSEVKRLRKELDRKDHSDDKSRNDEAGSEGNFLNLNF